MKVENEALVEIDAENDREGGLLTTPLGCVDPPLVGSELRSCSGSINDVWI